MNTILRSISRAIVAAISVPVAVVLLLIVAAFLVLIWPNLPVIALFDHDEKIVKIRQRQ
jgi:hypothetical protein